MPAETVLSLHDAPAATVEQLRARPEALGLEPIMVRREEAAELFSVGVATWDRWDSAGVLGPVAIKRGGVKLWLLAELREWAAAAMPCRAEWMARRGAANAGGRRPR
jgi:hypothetical protein